jgi:hypothetical protein
VPEDFPTIGEAVDSAAAGDTILVAAGIYAGELNRNIDPAGRDLVFLAPSGSSTTIIDLEGAGRAFEFQSHETRATLIRGFTIRNGDVGINSSQRGGAVRCWQSDPSFEDCVFENCEANVGGAVMAYAASPSFLRCEFAGNGAVMGGAVCNLVGLDMVITDCLFRGNRRAVGVEGTVKISGCDFWGNTGVDPASCLYLWGNDSLVENCTFVGNSHRLFNLTTTTGTVIRNSVIAFNVAAWAHCSGSTLIDHCVSYGNAPSDTLCWSMGEIMFTDPLMCDAGSFDTSLCADSPCLPESNPWGELVGAHGMGCGPCATPVESSSWSSVKALYR